MRRIRFAVTTASGNNEVSHLLYKSYRSMVHGSHFNDYHSP